MLLSAIYALNLSQKNVNIILSFFSAFQLDEQPPIVFSAKIILDCDSVLGVVPFNLMKASY